MDLKDSVKSVATISTKKRVDRRLIYAIGLLGILMIVLTVWLGVSDWRKSSASSAAEAQGRQALKQLQQPIQSLKRALSDEQVQVLAVRAVENPETAGDLFAYLNGRIKQVQSVDVFPAEAGRLDPKALGPNGFAVLAMILSALEEKQGLMQIHYTLQPPRLYDAIPIRSNGAVIGALVVSLTPEFLLSAYQPDFSSVGAIRLTQANGRQTANHLGEWGDVSRMGHNPERLAVAGTEFRLEFPRWQHVGLLSGVTMLIILTVGLLLLTGAVLLNRQNRAWEAERTIREERKPEAKKAPAPSSFTQAGERDTGLSAPPDAEFDGRAGVHGSSGRPAPESPPDEPPAAPPAAPPEPPPMQLHYDIAERRRLREAEHSPVELSPEIFRAYDIRGVIDKTLDSGVAHSVGQAIGTVALEASAGPVVVARDGRLSGPYLMQGMIEGIVSAGCDVLDIGAVPTGVLYYAAHEMAAGSGVMITGSHNPPDYNGFKIMIGGDTLYGDAIKGLYSRITAGDLLSGQGSVTRKDVIPDYIRRIADDIRVERDLKVVIDCGNGIGGVCAADALRAIGVEVLPLFDEVDGTFPNHHPDPGDPENLQDLIESVRLMDADLGLAFDGDADRLGVVTLAGNIIYPDRVMMLLAMDVLDRNPGATIIYDVKCTGHLPKVIIEAGGNPVMYKTGHSLIKAKMKEIGSPFAGEMSGHFFFGERWYGVDDGIYAAARLLEILSSTETPPEAILNALPSSFSTPELKVQMEEGQNHAFIEAFKLAARFDDAQISTIDGLRADFDDGWGLVRASNTTPILVVRFDAETEEALTRIKANFRSQMLAVNPDLELPF
jgi:phosphomannomutase